MGHSERQNTLALTLLAGVAGLGMGLLFAPRSGKETRQRLRETATEVKANAGDGLESAKERLDDQLDKVRAAKSNLMGKIRRHKRADATEDAIMDSPIIKAWDEEV